MSKKCLELADIGLSGLEPRRDISGHSIVFKQHNESITEETRIYRYMRLSTLLDMLYYGKMHVSNRLNFTDLREKKGIDNTVEPLPLFNIFPNYQDRLRNIRIEKERQSSLSICASCWTLDRRNNGHSDESYLMWKAYSKDEITCRVGTTIGRLIKSITHTPSDIVISEIDYKGESKMNEREKLTFSKSNFYEDEQEVRMVVLSNERQGVDLDIDIQELLEEIKISPFVPPILGFFLLRHLKEWCDKYKTIRIEYSNLMEYVETNKDYKITKGSRI